MFRIKQSLFAFLAAALLLVPGAVPVRAEDPDIIPQEDIRADTVNYKSEEVIYGTFIKTESTAGNAYYPSMTHVIYDGLRALYVETLVEFGSHVEAGQELLKVEVERDEAGIREKELKLEQARSAYEIGLRDRRRTISNMNADRDRMTDPYAIQKANLEIQRAEIQLNRYIYSTEREIGIQEDALKKLTEENEVMYVTAPIAGKITEQKYFQQGDYVNPGDVLFRITDTSVFYVAAESSSFHFGTEVNVSAFVRGKEFLLPGEVIVCTSDIKGAPKSRVLVRVEIPEEVRTMAENMSMFDYTALRLTMSADTCRVDDVLLMPTDAKENSGQDVYVNILDASNTVHRRAVSVAFSNRQYSWVLTGLEEGDRVILN